MQKKQSSIVGLIGVMLLMITPFFVVESAQHPYVRINRGSATTKDRTVNLYIQGPSGVDDMQISNVESFQDAKWEPYTSRKEWTLDFGKGTKKVYVRFRDSNGKALKKTYWDTIQLHIPSKMEVSMTIDDNEDRTDVRYVTIHSDFTQGVERVRLSEDPNFSGAKWVDVSKQLSFILSAGGGNKRVYAEFWDANNKKVTVSDDIYYAEPAGVLSDRSVIQGQGSAVYYLGVGGAAHPFFNSQVYFSWFDDFNRVTPVSSAKLGTYQIGPAVCMRAGTWLVKFSGFADVYMAETGCRLRPIYSEVEAYVLFGPNWQMRIAELPLYTRSSYRIVDPRLDDLADDETDNDDDGVPKRVEEEYGTSDRRSDTDNDSLSDYEEIYFWFTDPTDNDSDDDGFLDGREILSGFSPLGDTSLGSIPKDTYTYARGSVVRHPVDNDIYIVDEKGRYRYLGRNASDKRFTSNDLSKRYIIDPPYNIRLLPVSNQTYPTNNHDIKFPTTNGGANSLLPL